MKKEATGFRLVFGYLGIFLVLIGFLTLLPLAILAFYPSEWNCYLDFLIPGASSMVVGFILYFTLIFSRPRSRFVRNEDSALLILLWVAAVVVGAFPFYISGLFGEMTMTFTESIFESTSAYATTGLSVFKDFLDVDGSFCPHIFLFHRSLMQFIGGVGLVLIVASLLNDKDNLKLYFAEGHNDKLMPSLGRSAKLIFGIYTGYTVLGALAFWLSGMDVFDSINHAMCALSTAGFSTRSTSLSFYRTYAGNGVFSCQPIAIDIIAMVLMILGATSFVLHTFLFTGKFKKFIKDSEIKFAFVIMILAVLVCFLSGSIATMTSESSLSYWQDFWYSLFAVVSSFTTTGFSNFSISEFTALGKVVALTGIILMAIGGGVGSTAGGIKQYRVFLTWKDLWHSLRYRFSSPRSLNPNTSYRYGELREIDGPVLKEAHNYSVLFILTMIVGTGVCAFLPNLTIGEATYEFTSALSGTGLSIIDLVGYGISNPVYDYNILLWTLTIGMFIGRLEILPLIYAFRNIFDEVDFHKKERDARRRELSEEAVIE